MTIVLPVCAWEGCDRVASRRGLCPRCVKRALDAGTYHDFVDPRSVGRLCVVCNEPIPQSARLDRKTCSDSCRTAKNTKPEVRAAWLQSTANTRIPAERMRQGARRAREAGAVAVDGIDIAGIRLRDDNTCWICDGRIDPSRSFPDPQSETTDHVVPISRGGSHTVDNIGLAHLSCNVVKGDKILEKRPRWWRDESHHAEPRSA